MLKSHLPILTVLTVTTAENVIPDQTSVFRHIGRLWLQRRNGGSGACVCCGCGCVAVGCVDACLRARARVCACGSLEWVVAVCLCVRAGGVACAAGLRPSGARAPPLVSISSTARAWPRA